MRDTPTVPFEQETSIWSVQSSPGVPPGVAVMVGPDRIVDWMGEAKNFKADAPWRAGSSLNLNMRDYVRVQRAVMTSEKGITVQ